jgi:hypothetical protein
MLPVLDSQKNRLQELTSRGKPLSTRYNSNPAYTHLALELKIIDDQIADCNQQNQDHRRMQK